MLRTLPERARRRMPLRVRARARWLAFARCSRSPRGRRDRCWPPTARSAARARRPARRRPASRRSRSRARRANDYDPIGDDGEHDDQAAFALDGNPSTTWSTERYHGGCTEGRRRPLRRRRARRGRQGARGAHADPRLRGDDLRRQVRTARLDLRRWLGAASRRAGSVQDRQRFDLDTAGQSVPLLPRLDHEAPAGQQTACDLRIALALPWPVRSRYARSRSWRSSANPHRRSSSSGKGTPEASRAWGTRSSA